MPVGISENLEIDRQEIFGGVLWGGDKEEISYVVVSGCQEVSSNLSTNSFEFRCGLVISKSFVVKLPDEFKVFSSLYQQAHRIHHKHACDEKKMWRFNVKELVGGKREISCYHFEEK